MPPAVKLYRSHFARHLAAGPPGKACVGAERERRERERTALAGIVLTFQRENKAVRAAFALLSAQRSRLATVLDTRTTHGGDYEDPRVRFRGKKKTQRALTSVTRFPRCASPGATSTVGEQSPLSWGGSHAVV